MNRLPLLVVLLVSALLLIPACAGSGSSRTVTATPEASVGSSELVPQLVNSAVVPGMVRLQFAVTDSSGVPQEGLGGQVNLYQLQGNIGTLRVQSPLLPITLSLGGTAPHVQGHTEQHLGGDSVTVYVANVELDAGSWGAELVLSRDNQPLAPMELTFAVAAAGAMPTVGALAPPSVQPLLADVANIAEIDTSQVPDPEMHQLTVADAIRTGKPTVVAFMTPGFCTSRLCGPVLEQVVVPLREEFGERAQFIHIEPYSLKEARAEGKLLPVPAVQQWGLQTEPWLFVIDGNGRVAASFEGIVSIPEVRGVLTAVIK